MLGTTAAPPWRGRHWWGSGPGCQTWPCSGMMSTAAVGAVARQAGRAEQAAPRGSLLSLPRKRQDPSSPGCLCARLVACRALPTLAGVPAAACAGKVDGKSPEVQEQQACGSGGGGSSCGSEAAPRAGSPRAGSASRAPQELLAGLQAAQLEGTRYCERHRPDPAPPPLTS